MSALLRRAKIAVRRTTVYFYFTARPRWLNPLAYLRRRYEASAERLLRERYPEVYRVIGEMRARSGSTGCQYGDYLTLYEDLLEKKPRCVLECGSGISTAVVALALEQIARETGDEAVCVSLEEAEGWYRDLEKVFPEELRGSVRFIHSPKVVSTFGGRPGCHYAEIPDLPYDYIFVDGPTESSGPGMPKGFDADIVNLLTGGGQVETVSGLLDQRVGTYWMYRKIFGSRKVRYSPVRQLSFLQGLSPKDADPRYVRGS